MKILCTLSLLLGLVSWSTQASAQAYERGQEALREKDWSAAVEAFRDAERRRERVDAALYWRAYALRQLGREREAGGVAKQVVRRYPDSPWTDDAAALLDELGQGEPDVGQDAELRLFALQRLIDGNPDRALPLIRDMLAGNPDPDTRRQLLFILAASDSAEANELVLRTALDSDEPDLQIQAIHMLGAGSDGAAIPQLTELYRASTSESVRRAIIDAHLMADEPEALARLIGQEKSADLQRHGIVTLGGMGAVEELKGIYRNLPGTRERGAVLEALAISGDVSELAGIIESETDPELRVTAIRSLGMAGDDGSSDEMLARLAATATSPEELVAILEAVTIMDSGAETVLAVARRSTSPEVSRRAIQTLAILDESEAVMDLYRELRGQSPEVDRAMLEALMLLDDGAEIAVDMIRSNSNPEIVMMAIQTLGMLDEGERLTNLYPSLATPELKRTALQHMMAGDNEEGVRGILKTETDPQLRAEAIRAMAVMDVSADEDLLRIYRNGTPEEKSVVVETWMIQESDEAVVMALEEETDPTFKRRLIEALVVMDSEEADEYLFEWLER
ncbi:MAG: HEAT repeat domain-containing protein [Pseudomonadota bacterium]